MASIDLWKTSGHFDFYKDDMFDQMEVEGAEYQIKPMNCPFHVLVFKDSPRSYRDLPIRWAELGTPEAVKEHLCDCRQHLKEQYRHYSLCFCSTECLHTYGMMLSDYTQYCDMHGPD